MQQKKTIILIIALFAVSFSWLFLVSRNLENNTDWWAIYFSNPASDSLDFVIENNSDKTKFHWEILADNKMIEEGNAGIIKGQLENIKPAQNIEAGGRIIIQVISGEEKKEIYKNFDK